MLTYMYFVPAADRRRDVENISQPDIVLRLRTLRSFAGLHVVAMSWSGLRWALKREPIAATSFSPTTARSARSNEPCP